MLLKLAIPILSVAGETFLAKSHAGIPYQQLDGHILKQAGDYREYVGLILENNLKVLLIADNKTTSGAVAMKMGTGWREDPDDMPGLTNLCNQVLLERNSVDNMSFQKYIFSLKENIITHTDYSESDISFKVSNYELDLSLELFSELFVTPSFDEETIRKKSEELQKSYERGADVSSYSQVAKAALNTSHKFTRNGLGPLQLEKLSSAALQTHFNAHYSSNLMTLVVLGNTDMETLKQMVIPKFSKIKNNQLKPTNYGSPYTKENLGKYITVNSKYPNVGLTIRFGLDSLTGKSYKQFRFIEYLLDSTSLVRMLKDKGHKGGLRADVKQYDDFAEFNVRIPRVADRYVNKMVHTVFAFLESLKSQKIQPENYQAFLESLSSYVIWDTNPRRHVIDVAENLAKGNFSSVLGCYRDEVDVPSLTSALDLLNTTNVNVYYIAPFPSLPQTEPLFGRNFDVVSFPEDLLALLRTAKNYSDIVASSESYDSHIPMSFKLNKYLGIN